MWYEILGADDLKNLEVEVQKAIDDGWEPLGGVSVTSHYASWENERKGYTESETVYTYLQAMILRVDDDSTAEPTK